MPLALNDLYRYVFGDARIIQGKIDKFKFIVDDPKLSDAFRGLLRQFEKHDLEDHFYGDHTTPIDSKPVFQREETIRQQFQLLNKEYQYFSDDVSAENHFLILFRACKLMTDFVDKNNTKNDEVAYLHAYKILVLFGVNEKKPFSSVENFIKKQSKGKSLHDILIYDIPKNNPPLKLQDWQKLISTTGSKAFEIFQQAHDFEKKHKEVPKNLSEIEAKGNRSRVSEEMKVELKHDDFVLTEAIDTYVRPGSRIKTLALEKTRRDQFKATHPFSIGILQRRRENPLGEEGAINADKREHEGEYFLTPEFLALFVYYKIIKQKHEQYDKENIFVIIGSNNLSNTLTSLQLSKEGDNAKIIYIDGHAYTIYLRNIGGNIRCFILDTEPDIKDTETADIVVRALPQTKVIFNSDLLQLDYFSCPTFAIKALMYFCKMGDQFFQQTDNPEFLENIRQNIFLLRAGKLPASLYKLSQRAKAESRAMESVVSYKHKKTVSQYRLMYTSTFFGREYNLAAIRKKYRYIEQLENALQQNLTKNEKKRLTVSLKTKDPHLIPTLENIVSDLSRSPENRQYDKKTPGSSQKKPFKSLNLEDLYRYLFGIAEVIEEKNEEIFAKRKQKIIDKFQSIVGDPQLSISFRGLLRQFEKNDLEDYLYGDHITLLESEPNFPNEETIRQQFQALDNEYLYFSNDKLAEQHFIMIFRACKLMADFVEKNNTENDTIAYLHAYKILVLFGAREQSPFSLVKNFIDMHGNKFRKPVHDILIYDIPKNFPPIKLSAWQKLIAKAGFKAIELFQQAPLIENLLSKAPEDFAEIEAIASKLTYPRAEEYPELARLCKKYHVTEEVFNKCLEIKPKQSDKLPDVVIDGSLVNQKGYFLVKLPINDPRAFILGHITQCCQSIGSFGEICVIDGITLERNGFYVLLKAKAIGEQNPMVNGKINYEQFDIQGQGYAWLSHNDNLTFDSWENLTPQRDDDVIVPILKEFGRVVTEDKNSPIIRVTIGKGGKTPKKFLDNVDNPEQIPEGLSYDAHEQSIVFYNHKKAEPFKKEMDANFYRFHQIKKPNIHVTSIRQVEKINELFLNETNISHYKEIFDKISYDACLNACRNNTNFFNLVFYLHKACLLNQDIFQFITAREEYAIDILNLLSILDRIKPGLVNEENLKFLADDALRVRQIIPLLSTINKIAPRLLNLINIKLLLIHAKNAVHIHFFIGQLYKISPSCVNDAYFKMIIDHAERSEHEEHPHSIVSVIMILGEKCPSLINDLNLKLLGDHAEHVHHLSEALYSYSVLLNEEHFKFLVSNMQYARNLSEILFILHSVDSGLVNATNREILANKSEYCYQILRALVKLNEIDKKLMSDANFKHLVAYGADAEDIADSLIISYKADPKKSDPSNTPLGSRDEVDPPIFLHTVIEEDNRIKQARLADALVQIEDSFKETARINAFSSSRVNRFIFHFYWYNDEEKNELQRLKGEFHRILKEYVETFPSIHQKMYIYARYKTSPVVTTHRNAGLKAIGNTDLKNSIEAEIGTLRNQLIDEVTEGLKPFR